MRIIHTVPAISDEASGPSYSVRSLCDSLISQGQNVDLAVLDWAPLASPPSYLKSFPLGLGPRRLGRSPAMRRWLEREARSDSGIVFHNHSLWMMPNVYPGQLMRKYKNPFIVSPRGTFTEYALSIGSKIKPLFWRLVQRPALSAVSCFHATSASEYADIRRMGFTQPVTVIPNGIDVPERETGTPSNSRRLLFLARIHPNKGLDLLLPAWRAVQDRFPNWELRIVGPDEGGYLAAVRRLSMELGLGRIEFCGPCYGDQKWREYRDADLYVLPTHSENFGMTVAEALAASTPTIVTKGAPWGDLESRGAGWWIDIGVDSLAACLEKALACSPETLSQMGIAGREWMLEEYSWKRVGAMMAATYRWLLHGGERPAWVHLD
jgi:glycosyltransferase involved in cell wall biosynthesis